MISRKLENIACQLAAHRARDGSLELDPVHAATLISALRAQAACAREIEARVVPAGARAAFGGFGGPNVVAMPSRVAHVEAPSDVEPAS